VGERHAADHQFASQIADETSDVRNFRGLRETHEGCTATVRGPEGDHTRRHMRTAIKRLLKTLG
jgi:hypothetical protein